MPLRRTERGFTYLALLFTVAMAGIALAAAGVIWSTERQREREKELLFVGNQFRQAIRMYYEYSPGTIKQYPRSLNDLLQDNRYLRTERRLRRVYADPITGQTDWGLVPAPGGGIMGVFSLSNDRPMKTAGFALRDSGFEGASKYADWQFVYTPPTAMPSSPESSGSR